MRSGLCRSVELTLFLIEVECAERSEGAFFDGLMKAQRVNIVAMRQ